MGGGGVGLGGQGRCEQRSEVFVKNKKKCGGGGRGGGGGWGGFRSGGGGGLLGGQGGCQVKSSQVNFYSVLILNKES